MALLRRAAGLVGLLLVALPVAAAAQSLREFPIPTAAGKPYDIVAGPDGNLWFTEKDGNKIGRFHPSDPTRIDEFPLYRPGASPAGITVGPDGNIWFAEFSRPAWIGQSDLQGGIVEYYVPNGASMDIASGPDGGLWFTEPFDNRIGRMTTSGEAAEFPVPAPLGAPQFIAGGPDGRIWVTCTQNRVGRFNTNGDFVDSFTLSTANATPQGIALGPDGNMWVAEYDAHKIARITANGAIDEFPLPGMNSRPVAITSGPDNNLWATVIGGRIARITTSGEITEFTTPGSFRPVGITTGADGNLWYVVDVSNVVGRVSFGATETPTATPTPSPAPPASATATLTQSPTATRTATPRPLSVRLLNRLALTDTQVVLDDVTVLPRSGVLRIGNELVAYDGFQLAPESGANAGRLLSVQRGAEGSQVAPHPPDSVVVLVRSTLACVGDCDGDRVVNEADVLAGIAIALGREPLTACRSFDYDYDADVTVDELILSILVKLDPNASIALSVCPPPTPTPTSTGTVTPTGTVTLIPVDTATVTRTPTRTATITPTRAPTIMPTVTHTFRPLTCPVFDPSPFKSGCGEVTVMNNPVIAGETLVAVVNSHCGAVEVTASYGIQEAEVDGMPVEVRVGRARLYGYFGSPVPLPVERKAIPPSYIFNVPEGPHTVEIRIDPDAPRNCVRPDGIGPWIWIGGNVVGQTWSTPVPFVIER